MSPTGEAALVESRIVLRSNPRILVIVSIPPVLIVAMIVVSLVADALLLLVIIAPLGYVAYRVGRYVAKQLRSRVRLFSDRIELDLLGEDSAVIPWHKVTRAGLARSGGRASVYVYCEFDDQLLELPDEFRRFEQIVEGVRNATNFGEIDLDRFATVADYFRAEQS